MGGKEADEFDTITTVSCGTTLTFTTAPANTVQIGVRYLVV